MSEDDPDLKDILHFQNLMLIKIYDVLMHSLGAVAPNVASELEKYHAENKFGVEVE